MDSRERTDARDNHDAPSMAAVRSIGALGCVAAAVLLQHALTSSSVATFALGGIAFAVSVLALRAPNVFWSPAGPSPADAAREREDAESRLASNDR